MLSSQLSPPRPLSLEENSFPEMHTRQAHQWAAQLLCVRLGGGGLGGCYWSGPSGDLRSAPSNALNLLCDLDFLISKRELGWLISKGGAFIDAFSIPQMPSLRLV